MCGKFGSTHPRRVIDKNLARREKGFFSARKRGPAKQSFGGQLDKWARAQPEGVPKTLSELFMRNEGLSLQAFSRLQESYLKHASMHTQNIHKAPDALAQEVAKESNIPYLKAYRFVNWARWALKDVLRENLRRELIKALKKRAESMEPSPEKQPR